MKVNIAACGKFHYGSYVRYVAERHLLGKFFYSHRLSTDRSALGLPRGVAENIWIKEYLVGIHYRLLGSRGITQVTGLYGELWQAILLLRWRQCDVFHFLVHGSCLRALDRAKREGSVTLGEPVHAHPLVMNQLVNEEYQRLGLRAHQPMSPVHRRQIEEARTCDFLLAPSSWVKQSFVANGLPEEKIGILPYGVDTSRFVPPAQPPPRRPFRVICVASITPCKGHAYLLEAWKRLRLADAELVLVGGLSCHMAPLMRKYAGSFLHLPHVPNAKLPEHYGSSSVFVLPSVQDGFGVVALEAQACGLPAIVTSNCGAADAIAHGTDGFVAPARSADQLAHYLELLYRDEPLRQSMSQAAARKAKASFGWDQYAEKLCQTYRGLWAARNGPASPAAQEARPIQGRGGDGFVPASFRPAGARSGDEAVP
ncbi:MAG TPA: glycosyltransferase family 4 protein, partial [Dongiaceae bacterium]|nr:glycosyltransferase family 4 protein [Dongiaceae bacterium]